VNGSVVPVRASRWALVDFNGVLGRQPGHRDWAELAAAAAWTASLEELQQAFWERRPAFDLGAISPAEFWGPLVAPGACLEETVAVDAAMWLEIDPEVLRVLQSARSNGTRLVMLSNAPVPVADLITAAPWSDLFDDLVFSCHIRASKPSPQAFQAALDIIGSPDPGEVLLVDDRADNIASAVSLGLNAHLYQDRALLNPAAPGLRRPPLRLVTSPA
jgi:putative hydrolase of the HAD superfamily